jgi:hypothetical protein
MINSKGGCLCASVKYEITAEPMALFCCHCSECQTTLGSSFTLALRMPYDGVRVTRGSVQLYVRPEADGQKRHVARCTKCLTPLWSEAIESPQFKTVYAGTLDDSPSLVPVAHIWTEDAQPWIKLPEWSLQYPQNPPDMTAIKDAWRTRAKAGPSSSKTT